MKIPFVSLSMLVLIATGAMAGPDRAINGQIDKLTKKVSEDLAGGMLTQSDADELNREISQVQGVEQSEPSLTRRTREDLREKLSKIQKDLERKEAQAKALASPSSP